MTPERRQFLKLTAGMVALPTVSHNALAQRLPNPSDVPVPSQAERAATARLAQTFMRKYDAPALSFAVGYAGAIVHQDAFGMADRENNEVVTPTHRFRIASLTKPITSVAIFTLIEQGRLDLSDRVIGPGALLGTDYRAPPYPGGVDEITVEHLLTHTCGGWSNDDRDPMFRNPAMSRAELIAWTLANRPLDDAPGRRYAYSNFGYCLLGRVIEKVAGRPYDDFVRATVLDRSGVAAMRIGGGARNQCLPGEVRYYSGASDGDPYRLDPARMDSHGGWIARPSDYVRFLMHVDSFSAPPNILKPQTLRIMTTPSAANANYAKGWCVTSNDNWWHNGSLPGATTVAVRTHGGFCWAAFVNIRHTNSSMAADLDALNWDMVRQVAEWRV
jgi:CubicO group peptidase (beta-lactamase class C family)